jgi:ligand-binding sensor domain-containing protein
MYKNETWTAYNASNSDLPGNNVLSMVEDLNGNLWIGVVCNTLSRLDRNGKITNYGRCCKLGCNYNIMPTIVDSKNNIWCRRLCENGGGLVVFGPDVPDLNE